MRRSTIITLIVATALTLFGVVLVAVGLLTTDRSNINLLFNNTQINTYTVNEPFSSIDIQATTADITLAISEDGVCRVVCYEHKKVTHTTEVNNGFLVVREKDDRAWYDHIGIFIGKTGMTLYLPKQEYDSLNVDCDTGNIDIPRSFSFNEANINTSTGNVDFSAKLKDLLSVSTSTGNIYIENTACKSITAKSSTGNILLRNVTATADTRINSSTGNVDLENFDAASIYVKTSTGNVCGTILSEKIFISNTSTGNVSIPKTTSGGICEITTSTGDIDISIK